MAEGIEFRLELLAKLDAANQMVQQLNRVEKEALQTDAALKRVEHRTEGFNSGLKKIGSSFASVGRTTLGHLTALATFAGFQSLVHKVTALGEEALIAAGEAERTRKSFELMMGVEPATEVLSFLDQLAKKTEFTDGALKGFASQLIRSGYSGEKLTRAMAGVVDMAAMTQNKMEGAGSAVSLLSMLELRGTLAPRQISSAGLDVNKFYDVLAKAEGVGQKRIKKMLSEGKISAENQREALFTVITDKTGKGLGGAGVSMGGTFLAQFEKAKEIIPELFESLEEAGGLKKITAGLGKLVETLSPDSPAGQKIIGGLTTMLDRFGELITKIDFDVWSERLVVAMDIFSTTVELAAELGRELGMVFDFFTSMGEAIGDTVYDMVAGVTSWFDGVISESEAFGEALYELPQMLGHLFDAFKEIGRDIWRGIKEGLLGGVTEVVDSVKFLGKEAVGALKGIFQSHSPSQVFADIGFDTSAGFQLGIESSIPDVVSTMQDAFDPSLLMSGIPELPSLPELPQIPTVPELLGLPEIEIPTLESLSGAVLPAGVNINAGGAGGGGGAHNEVHITVNVGGVADEGQARRAGEQVAFAVRKAWESIASQLAVEGGAA